MNALYPLHYSVDALLNEQTPEDRSSHSAFDLATFRMTSVYQVTDDNGKKKTLHCNERYYAPSEMHWLLSSLGFHTIEIFGCMPGQFRRDKSVTPDDYELLIVASC